MAKPINLTDTEATIVAINCGDLEELARMFAFDEELKADWFCPLPPHPDPPMKRALILLKKLYTAAPHAADRELERLYPEYGIEPR